MFLAYLCLKAGVTLLS